MTLFITRIKFLLELAVTCLEFDKLESAEECVNHLKKLANVNIDICKTL